MPIALALTTRLVRLRERLAGYQPSTDDDASLLWAAVAVILTPEPDGILLIRRAERTGDPWGGHMALPGGRREPTDQDLLTKDEARERLVEEIGRVKARLEELQASTDDPARIDAEVTMLARRLNAMESVRDEYNDYLDGK